MLPPGGFALPDTRGHLSMLADSNSFLNNSNTKRQWICSMAACGQVAESGDTYGLLRPLWVNTEGSWEPAHLGLDKSPAGIIPSILHRKGCPRKPRPLLPTPFLRVLGEAESPEKFPVIR